MYKTKPRIEKIITKAPAMYYMRKEIADEAKMTVQSAYRMIPADFTINCIGGQVGLISSIAKVRSVFFERLLSEQFKEGVEKTVTFDFEKDVIRAVVDYLHFGDLPQCSDPRNDIQIYRFAELHGLVELKRAMESTLEMWSRSKYSLLVYQLCTEPFLDHVKELCLNFIKKVFQSEKVSMGCKKCGYRLYDARCEYCKAYYMTHENYRLCLCRFVFEHGGHGSCSELEACRMIFSKDGVSDETMAEISSAVLFEEIF